MAFGLGAGLDKYKYFSGFDPDAEAFINAVIAAGGTLDDTQRFEINRLVLNLKGRGDLNSTVNYWDTEKIQHYYPVVGGVEAAHAICLMTLMSGTFGTGWTHSSSGALSDGTADGYFDTGFIESSLPTSSGGIGLYSNQTKAASDLYSCGAQNEVPSVIAIGRRQIGDITYGDFRGGLNAVLADTTGKGDYQVDRISATHVNYYKDTVGSTQVSAERTAINTTVYFGGIHHPDLGVILPDITSFATMRITWDLSVDGTEAQLLQQITTAYQVAVGRN